MDIRGATGDGRVLRTYPLAGGNGRAAGHRSANPAGAVDLRDGGGGGVGSGDRASDPAASGLSVDLRRSERQSPHALGLPQSECGSAQRAAHAERDDVALGGTDRAAAGSTGWNEGASLGWGLVVPAAEPAGEAHRAGARAGRGTGQGDRGRSWSRKQAPGSGAEEGGRGTAETSREGTRADGRSGEAEAIEQREEEEEEGSEKLDHGSERTGDEDGRRRVPTRVQRAHGERDGVEGRGGGGCGQCRHGQACDGAAGHVHVERGSEP